MEWKSAGDDSFTVALKDTSPGDASLEIKQFGLAQPSVVMLHSAAPTTPSIALPVLKTP